MKVILCFTVCFVRVGTKTKVFNKDALLANYEKSVQLNPTLVLFASWNINPYL